MANDPAYFTQKGEITYTRGKRVVRLGNPLSQQVGEKRSGPDVDSYKHTVGEATWHVMVRPCSFSE
jgi:hypothetical protein